MKTLYKIPHMVHCERDSRLCLEQDMIVVVNQEGYIEWKGKERDWKTSLSETNIQIEKISKHQAVIPGFVDTHTHASQFAFIGNGLDRPLLEWLETYTFKEEARYQNSEYAERQYRQVVQTTLKYGTTTCCYYGTLHRIATQCLANLMIEYGQRGLVGKVCMDQLSPKDYQESTEDAIQETKAFIDYLIDKENKLVIPVVTPRFAITCSEHLMKALGALCRNYRDSQGIILPIQTHLSENKNEVKTIQSMYPHHQDYSSLYDACGLLTKRTIMAHAIYLSPNERKLLIERESGIAHCPNSNFSLGSGMMNVKQYMNEGMKIGLGTDVSGGASPSMLDAIRCALWTSKMVACTQEDKSNQILTLDEAFFLATLGGANVLGLESNIGNFEVGKAWDALVIDLYDPTDNSTYLSYPIDVEEKMGLNEANGFRRLFERFLMLGDDRNISQVYVQGRCVHTRRSKNIKDT